MFHIISWFLKDKIDVSLIGIKGEGTPTRTSDAPSHRRLLAGTVIISDDEYEDKNEKERADAQDKSKTENTKKEGQCSEPITSHQQRKFSIVAEEGNNNQEANINIPRARAKKNRCHKRAQRVEAGARKNRQSAYEEGDYHVAHNWQISSIHGDYSYRKHHDGGEKKRKKAKVKKRYFVLKDYLRSCVSRKDESEEKDSKKGISPESLTIHSMEENKHGISPDSGKITYLFRRAFLT